MASVRRECADGTLTLSRERCRLPDAVVQSAAFERAQSSAELMRARFERLHIHLWEMEPSVLLWPSIVFILKIWKEETDLCPPQQTYPPPGRCGSYYPSLPPTPTKDPPPGRPLPYPL